MMLEEAGDQKTDSVRAKVGRQIAHANPVMSVACAFPDRDIALRTFLCRPKLGGRKVFSPGVEQREAIERISQAAPGGKSRCNDFHIAFAPAPVASVQTGMDGNALRRDVIGIERKRFLG